MKLETSRINNWPKLAWVARFCSQDAILQVFHGPMVEVSSNWVVEAVWAGSFKTGDFDKSENVFGSGVRVRDDKAIFVTSSHVFDRLLLYKNEKFIFVSNTLPGLMAVSGVQLLDDYTEYTKDVISFVKGLDARNKLIPVISGNVESLYCHNLVLDGAGDVKIVEKDYTNKIFDNYRDYKDFLLSVAGKIGENAQDTARKCKVKMLSGISSGYDSTAASVVAREAGCRDTVTIAKASSLKGHSDSGAHIAQKLGMSCREYPRTAKKYPNEIALWAGEGRPGVLNWTLFNYPEPVCLFFTGCHGEKVWDRVDHDHPDPFVRRDTSSHGFCEYRLWAGVFQCPVPFIGIRQAGEIRKIAKSDEMAPWSMGLDYDKPTARRLVEESGIPRGDFGMSNKNTSLETAFRWPFSSDAQNSLLCYLKSKNIKTFPLNLIPIVRILLKIRHLFYRNYGVKKGWKHTEKISEKIPGYKMIFLWANSVLSDTYRTHLEKNDVSIK